MFTLLIHHIPLCGLFEGREGHYIPVHNTSRLNSREYYTAGKMIATALVHGGRAPHCFSVSFAEYIVYGKVKSDPDPKDIPDYAIQEKLVKVCMYVCMDVCMYVCMCTLYCYIIRFLNVKVM